MCFYVSTCNLQCHVPLRDVTNPVLHDLWDAVVI